jgi:H+-transporting ATPase
MWNPSSFVMEEVALLALLLPNGGGKAPHWEIFLGILLLLLLNSVMAFIWKRKSMKADQSLPVSLAPSKAKVKRNGIWTLINSGELVIGDIISVKTGDIIPADARIICKEKGFFVKKKFDKISSLFRYRRPSCNGSIISNG